MLEIVKKACAKFIRKAPSTADLEVWYYLTSEVRKLKNDERRRKHYGVRVELVELLESGKKELESRCAADLTTDKKRAISFFTLISECGVTPCSLLDVVEDELPV